MAFKTITLSEEAYKRLKERKKENESFSDVVLRLTNISTLRDFVGIIDSSYLDEIEKNIEKIREERAIKYIDSIKNDWVE